MKPGFGAEKALETGLATDVVFVVVRILDSQLLCKTNLF
jgi:hypothetical protein